MRLGFAEQRPDFVFSENKALVAQGIEHRFPKPGVGGSNPPEGAVKITVSETGTEFVTHN